MILNIPVVAQEISISFLCVPFSCCVWHFRKWLSWSLYQTAATFVLGGQPPYVESPHWFTSDFCFVTLPAPVYHICSSPAHTKRLHCSVCVDVCTYCLFPHFRVLHMHWRVLITQHVYFDASLLVPVSATVNTGFWVDVSEWFVAGCWFVAFTFLLIG